MRQQDLHGAQHSREQTTETWPNMQDGLVQRRG